MLGANGFLPGDKVDQQGWTINWEHTFGNFQVMAQYGQTGNIKNCDNAIIDCGDSKAIGYMVGGRYFLSKRTWLFASWNLVDNKSNNFADFTGGAITSTNAVCGQRSVGCGSADLGAGHLPPVLSRRKSDSIGNGRFGARFFLLTPGAYHRAGCFSERKRTRDRH